MRSVAWFYTFSCVIKSRTVQIEDTSLCARNIKRLGSLRSLRAVNLTHDALLPHYWPRSYSSDPRRFHVIISYNVPYETAEPTQPGDYSNIICIINIRALYVPAGSVDGYRLYRKNAVPRSPRRATANAH